MITINELKDFYREGLKRAKEPYQNVYDVGRPSRVQQELPVFQAPPRDRSFFSGGKPPRFI